MLRPPSLPSARIPLRRLTLAPSYASPDARYDTMVSPPATLLADGRYLPGWFSEEPARLNTFDNAEAGWRRLHRWFFLHFDSPDYFIGANIADLRLGGNVGIIVLDKRTGHFEVAERTALLLNNKVAISDDCRAFCDPTSGSYIRMLEDAEGPTGGVEFGLFVGDTRLVGQASAQFARPFVQSTRLGDALGTFQVWGNLRLEAATLTLNDTEIVLPSGSHGAFDRSLGHRRLLENWNWVATCGEARRGSDTVPFALHAALDRSGARPIVDAHKFVLWLGDEMVKVDDLRFDYDYLDEAERKTSAWRIHSRRTEGKPWVDLRFDPDFHRRDLKRIPLILNVDHSQYFGNLNGQVCAGGEICEVVDVFATVEDSMMVV